MVRKFNIEDLQRIELFRGLDEDTVFRIHEICQYREYKKGSVLVSERSGADSVYAILEGKVKVYRTSHDSKNVIFDIKGKDSIFGIVTIFADYDYPVTAEAISDVVIAIIDKDAFRKIILGSADLSLRIMKSLSRSLISFQNKAKEMAVDDAYMRAAKEILRLSKLYGTEFEGELHLNLGLTREELASLIGVSRETMSRILNRFHKEGSITISGKSIIITDGQKLKSWIK